MTTNEQPQVGDEVQLIYRGRFAAEVDGEVCVDDSTGKMHWFDAGVVTIEVVKRRDETLPGA